MDESKQEYLQDVLETNRMAHIDDLLGKYRAKRDEVKEELEKKYKGLIYNPINSGSFAKHTAINSKFDLDIAIPFKRNSFDTLEKMSDDVFEFLTSTFDGEANIRKQKVSIGVEFYPDGDDDIISLDIVPGRELNQDQYIDDKNMNLFVNSMWGVLSEKTYIQTNINAQIEHIKAKENERKIIRLLKIWKTSNREIYKSFLLELLTIKAFDQNEIQGNLWDKLKSILNYIKDNITKEGFHLTDPENSNNNVLDTLDNYQRESLKSSMSLIINNIETNEDNIKIYFPKNSDFIKEKSAIGGYGIKTATVGASIPPKNQRFG